MEKFAGFAKRAPQFWHELSTEMNKDWFDANKARYHAEWVEPLTAVLAEVRAAVAPIYAKQKIRIAEPKLLRIYRDVRFAKDKTPYKTHIAGVIRAIAPGDNGAAALYVQLGIDEEYTGVGSYFFADDKLVTWRKLVAADRTGKPLAALVDKLRGQGYRVGGYEDYKRVPKPFAADHPRAALLKQRGLTASFPDIPRGMLHSGKLVPWLVAHAQATAPLVAWLAKNLAR